MFVVSPITFIRNRIHKDDSRYSSSIKTQIGNCKRKSNNIKLQLRFKCEIERLFPQNHHLNQFKHDKLCNLLK